MLSLYNLVFKTVQWGYWVRDLADYILKVPYLRFKNTLIDDLSIEKATLIDFRKCGDSSSLATDEILYEFDWFDTFQRLFLIHFVFGREQWDTRYKHNHNVYTMSDPRLGSEGVYMYVRLANGKEFLTNKSFNSQELSHFCQPRGKYLFILIGSLDITKFMHRFWTSWHHLQLNHIDFVMLAMHIDPKINAYIRTCGRIDPSITTIDDDNFDESYFYANDKLLI